MSLTVNKSESRERRHRYARSFIFFFFSLFFCIFFVSYTVERKCPKSLRDTIIIARCYLAGQTFSEHMLRKNFFQSLNEAYPFSWYLG